MLQRSNHEYTPSEPLNDGTPPSVFTVMGNGAKLEGTFEVADSIQIECEVGGQLKVGKRLVIGERGSVRAEVETVDAIIHGQFKGNMVATGNVEITPTGRVVGKIQTDSLVISKGGFFNGKTLRLKESQAEGASPPEDRPKRTGLAAGRSRESRSAQLEAHVRHAAEDLALALEGDEEISPRHANGQEEDAEPVEPRAATSPRRSRPQAASRKGRKKKAKPKHDHDQPVTLKGSEDEAETAAAFVSEHTAEPLPPLPSQGEFLPDDVDLDAGSRVEDRLMMRLGLATGTAEESGSDLRDVDDPLTRPSKPRDRAQAASRGRRKKKAKPKPDHGRDVRTKESAVGPNVTPASAIEDMAEFLPPLPSGSALLSEDLDLDAGPPAQEQRGWVDMDERRNEARGSSIWEDDDLVNDPAPPPDEDPLGIR